MHWCCLFVSAIQVQHFKGFIYTHGEDISIWDVWRWMVLNSCKSCRIISNENRHLKALAVEYVLIISLRFWLHFSFRLWSKKKRYNAILCKISDYLDCLLSFKQNSVLQNSTSATWFCVSKVAKRCKFEFQISML